MAKALTKQKIDQSLRKLREWKLVKGKAIAKTYEFKNYYQTMAFVNAIAWIAHGSNHHPDLEVGYNKCKVTYSTHSVGGLSELDFDNACAVENLR